MDRKMKRRRSTSATVYVPIAALLVLFLMIYGTSAFLKIIEIEVEGVTRYSKAEIISAAGIGFGENLMLVDRVDAQRRIITELPYISDVKITRTMPDTVHIAVRESVPIAGIAFKGAVAVIDSAGKVLRLDDEPQAGLIEVRGFQPSDASVGSVLKSGADSETKMKYMIQMLSAIEDAGITKDVTFLDVASIANISLDFLERRVLLGGPEDAKSKLMELPERIAEINSKSPDDKAGVFNMSHRPWRWEPDR